MNEFLVNPVKKTISISGTPLETIRQQVYSVQNWYTKVNLINHILQDREEHKKVLIFMATKVSADRLGELLDVGSGVSVIHSGKEQNHRTKSIENFETGTSRVLIATDVIARGIDIEKISTVISFDVPFYPENYIHRIGRTGRAEEQGRSILLFTEKETEQKEAVERLMNYTIPFVEFPEKVPINPQKTPEEKNKPTNQKEIAHKFNVMEKGEAFHEKSTKNSKEPQSEKAYRRRLKEKYKKPQKRGDKIQNQRSKRKKR
jgi:ATP-dependent RNA helicase RhlE